MKMITLSANKQQLQGILDLQSANLPANLSENEITEQGFVTVQHHLAQLEKMNTITPHIIAVDKDKVIGYVLSMDPLLRQDVPVLIPMFDLINKIHYNNKQLSERNYLVCGQACVDKEYRNQGLLSGMYNYMKEAHSNRYDCCITEIAVSNQRSMKAHEKVGFKTIHRFSDATQEWNVVIWDWQTTL